MRDGRPTQANGNPSAGRLAFYNLQPPFAFAILMVVSLDGIIISALLLSVSVSQSHAAPLREYNV